MIQVARDADDKREHFSGREAQVGSTTHFVIADVGPLVSLALATLGDPAMMVKGTSYLDLLKAVRHPIEIVDQVKFECIYSGHKPDAAFIERWLERHAGQTTEVVTTIGCDVAERRAQGTYSNGRHKGELTTNDYLREFRDYRHSDEEMVIVLFEDARVARLLDGVENVHLLTTGALLRTLARSGLADYDHVTEAMRSQRDPRGRWNRPLFDHENEPTDFVAEPKLTAPAGPDADFRSVLEQYSTRGCSSLDAMRALHLEWKGDLVRALNSSGLSVPLGDVAESESAMAYVADILGRTGV
nr:hypothetical protein [Mesorhizobium sp.]